MEYNEKREEQILQNENFVMPSDARVRIQVSESFYVITLKLNTSMFKNSRMNTTKKGIYISSCLKKKVQKNFSNELVFKRYFFDLSQLKEDVIRFEDEYYSIEIVIRLSDFIRKDVKKICEKRLMCIM